MLFFLYTGLKIDTNEHHMIKHKAYLLGMLHSQKLVICLQKMDTRALLELNCF